MTINTEKARYYWCVKVLKNISPDKEIYLHAESAEIIDGNLIFKTKDGLINLSIYITDNLFI